VKINSKLFILFVAYQNRLWESGQNLETLRYNQTPTWLYFGVFYLYKIMDWNNVVCTNCGSVEDYTITRTANNDVCRCNGCDKFLGNKPRPMVSLDEVKMPFGKYKGLTIEHISRIDKQYLQWFYDNPLQQKHFSNSLHDAVVHYKKIIIL
jgi:hypothetical protein